MIYSANGKGAWPPVATERELHVGLMLSPQKCLLWLSCVAEVTVWMVLKRNLGIKCALFTIDWLLGLGQGFLTQFQRIAWKLLGKLELCNLFLPVSPVSAQWRICLITLFFISYQRAIQNVLVCSGVLPSLLFTFSHLLLFFMLTRLSNNIFLHILCRTVEKNRFEQHVSIIAWDQLQYSTLFKRMKVWAKLGVCPCLCSRELQNHKFFIGKKLKSCVSLW